MLKRKSMIATLLVALPVLSNCAVNSFIQPGQSHAVPNTSKQPSNIKHETSMIKAENSGALPTPKEDMGVEIIPSGAVYTTSNAYRLGTTAGGTAQDKSKPYLLPDKTLAQGLGASFSIWKGPEPQKGSERNLYVGPGGIIHLDDVSILVVHVETRPGKGAAWLPQTPWVEWVAIKELKKANP
jgi:hypothetical protein